MSKRDEETPAVVRAARFELVDEDGRCRAVLQMLQNGCPGLSLLDRDGNTRAVLSPPGDDPPSPGGLALNDATGTQRLALLLSRGGAPLLIMNDSPSKGRLGLWVDPDGAPVLELTSAAGRSRRIEP